MHSIENEKDIDISSGILQKTELRREKDYQLSPYRWIICIFFMIKQIGAGIGMVGFTSIAPIMGDVYRVSDISTSLLVLSYTIAFIPMNLPSNQLIERRGISWPIRIGCITTFIGAWIRIFCSHSFYYILAGQCIMALGNPFAQTIGAKIAAVWFGSKERALATTLTSLATVTGIMIGFVFPIFFVKDKDRPKIQFVKDRVWWYILTQSILVTALAIPIVFLVKNEPIHPPSRSAMQAKRKGPTKLSDTFKKLTTKLNFWIFSLSYSFIFSVYIVLGASIGIISNKYGFSSSDNSLFGVVFIISGLIGSIIHAMILDKFKKFKYQFIWIWIMSILSIGTVTFVMSKGILALSCVSLAFLGFSVIPVIGVGYSFCSEISYPWGEAISWGFMQIVGSILSTIVTLVVSYSLEHYRKESGFMVLGGWTIAGTILSLWVIEQLNKTNVSLKLTVSVFSVALVRSVDEKDDAGVADDSKVDLNKALLK